MPKSGPSNAELAKRISDAHMRAAQANAKVDLERARAEVRGKQVVFDYTPSGTKIKVIDRKK